MRVAVIGAGPAGATAAYCLAKAGVEVDVYEASDGIGGRGRSIELWGQTVDLGPHRFDSADPRVNELWLEVIGGDYEMVERRTRVYLRGRLFHYPLRPRETLGNLGVAETARCLAAYVWQRVRPGGRDPGDTFASWVTARFGERLYRHFFKTYTEKLWGVPADELDAEFAAGSIGDRSSAPFAHPRRGTGEVYSRMCEFVEKQGGRVHLDTPVARLVLDGTRVVGVRLNNGDVYEHDHVVSSMPLAVLAGRLPLPPEVAAASARLAYRNTVIVYLRTNGESVFPDNWVDVHAPELRVGRITNFDNWVPAMRRGEPETVLALEYWCGSEDDFWRWDDERHIALARRELARTGLVRAEEILDGEVLRMPKSSPVYRKGFRRHLTAVAEHLRGLEGLEVIGRYGAPYHQDQDHSILMGLLAAENVVDDAGHDLWAPPGRDPQRPPCRITATGLVSQPATRPSLRRR